MQIAQAEVRAGYTRKLDENSEPNKPLPRASLEGKSVLFMTKIDLQSTESIVFSLFS